MRHFILFCFALILSACSHFSWVNYNPEDNSTLEVIKHDKRDVQAQANPKQGQEEKQAALPTSETSYEQQSAPGTKAESPSSSSDIIESPSEETVETDSNNIKSLDNIAAKQENSPTTMAPEFILPPVKSDQPPSSKRQLSSIEENFDLIALIPQKKENTDFSDYGFITPTAGLEQKVNDELRDFRDKNVEASNNNLLDRLVTHFKLDLELDNKRIRSQLNWYVRNPEYLERVFQRSSRYLFYVVEEARKRDLPMELALLPFVESAYDPFAYSHGRASGLWQFIPGTGKIYGLYQDWWYDGRRDVLASTKAAYDYLSYLNKLFDGNWLHALAAYNSGSGRVSGAIRKNKKKNKPTDFWSLKLPRETKAYVPKLLALSKIVNRPADYGISLPAILDKPYFSVVKTFAQIDLAQAAKLADVEINEIYKLNPGFNQWASAPKGPHRLLVPVEKALAFEAKLSTLPPEKRLNWNRYKVKRGDSLIKIAKKFNTTPKLIKQVNRLKSNLIRERQKLLIPIASKGKSYYDLSQHNRLKSKQDKLAATKNTEKLVYKVKRGDTMWDLAMAHKVGVRSLAKWNGMAPTDPIRPGQELLIWSKKESHTAETTTISLPIIPQREMIKKIGYRVRKGDSLDRIANKFGVLINDIVSWNKLNKKKYLQPGQKLTIYVDLSNS